MKITSDFLKELSLFPERERNLRKIKRYSLYHTMWYRTDLWTHTRRVAWIVEEVGDTCRKVFGDSFDVEKSIAMALVHDDAEIIFGDIQAGNKEKMSVEDIKKIKEIELDSIEKISEKYPKYLGKYIYKELLVEVVNKKTIEAMVVNWADKYDAFCEALHEIYAGHKLWTEHVENEYGKILLPTEFYMRFFNSFQEKFPESVELFKEGNKWFVIPDEPDIFNFVNTSNKHTKEFIFSQKGYDLYDQWISLTLEKGEEEDIKNLYITKE